MRVSAIVKYGTNKPIPEDFRDSHAYTVTLRYGRRSYTVPFFTGRAWRREPSAADVLNCLISDANAENAGGFEPWCGEYGYDTDSRKAERTYAACCRVARELRRLLGSECDAARRDPESWIRAHTERGE